MCWAVPATAGRSRPNVLAPVTSILERVEELGRLDLDRYDGADRLQRELPGLVLQLARLRFGMVGPTNHFIELQEVEEVFDPDTAAKLGVAPGQMTLQYHAGGGVFPGAVGAMFGRRKHYPKQIRAAMSVVKPLYHGMSARSLSQLKQRYRLYFAGGCPPVPLDSDEGRRLMLANAAAMNYGFAFRIAIYAGLRQIATDVFGGPPGQLVVDSPHNSIYEEEVGGGPAVVHRHNSCRAYPADLMPPGTTFAQTGQAVLVPGTHRTSSYLCVAGGSADALYSACHGAGTVVSDFARRGISHQDSSTAPPCGSATTTLIPPVRRISMTGAWTKCSRCWSGAGWSAPWPGCARSRYCTEEDRDCALDHSGTAVGAAGAPRSRGR